MLGNENKWTIKILTDSAYWVNNGRLVFYHCLNKGMFIPKSSIMSAFLLNGHRNAINI